MTCHRINKFEISSLFVQNLSSNISHIFQLLLHLTTPSLILVLWSPTVKLRLHSSPVLSHCLPHPLASIYSYILLITFSYPLFYPSSSPSLLQSCGRCDARTQLEVQGYSAWLQGTVLFELAEWTQQWDAPVAFFNKAMLVGNGNMQCLTTHCIVIKLVDTS